MGSPTTGFDALLRAELDLDQQAPGQRYLYRPISDQSLRYVVYEPVRPLDRGGVPGLRLDWGNSLCRLPGDPGRSAEQVGPGAQSLGQYAAGALWIDVPGVPAARLCDGCHGVCKRRVPGI